MNDAISKVLRLYFGISPELLEQRRQMRESATKRLELSLEQIEREERENRRIALGLVVINGGKLK